MPHSQDKVLPALCSIVFVVVVTNLVVLQITTPYDRRSPEPSETEHQPPPKCNDDNWSAGSAFFTIAALCFGYYAYPRGSLVVARSGRAWRLSPVLAVEETILIVGLFLYAKIVRKHNTTTICNVILAYRFLNECNPKEVREVLGLTMNAPPLDETVEVYRLVREARLAAEQDVDAEEQGTTIAGPTSGPVWADTATRASDVPWHDGTTTDMRRFDLARKQVDERNVSYNAHLLQKFLHHTRELDKGPSYRIFVWGPMLLQAVKLLYVLVFSHRVSRWTYVLATIYFLSWLTIELIMIAVSSSPETPSTTSIQSAAELMHDWKDVINLFTGTAHLHKRAGSEEVFQNSPSLWPALFFNVILTGKFTYDLGLPYISNSWAAFFATVGLWAAAFSILVISLVPAVLWIPFLLAVRLLGMTRVTRWATTMKDQLLDFEVMNPAGAAVQGAVMIVFVFAEVGPWKNSFPCWSMAAPPDWFG